MAKVVPMLHVLRKYSSKTVVMCVTFPDLAFILVVKICVEMRVFSMLYTLFVICV